MVNFYKAGRQLFNSPLALRDQSTKTVASLMSNKINIYLVRCGFQDH